MNKENFTIKELELHDIINQLLSTKSMSTKDIARITKECLARQATLQSTKE